MEFKTIRGRRKMSCRDCWARQKNYENSRPANAPPPPMDFKKCCRDCGKFLTKGGRLKTKTQLRCAKCEKLRQQRVQERKERLVSDAKMSQFLRCAHCLEQFAPDALYFVSKRCKGLRRFDFADPLKLRVTQLPDELEFGLFLCSSCWTTSHIQQFLINVAESYPDT